jgi:hypothetical protein
VDSDLEELEMKLSSLVGGICALALAFGMSGAFASDLIDGTDPNAILDVAKGFGSATLEKDDTGDPKISGRIEGVKYGIYFYGCEAGASCTEIQFAAGWSDTKVPMAEINEWNRTKRFGKAYLDKENDPILEAPVNLKNGVSVKNLESTFEWWGAIVKVFENEVIPD